MTTSTLKNIGFTAENQVDLDAKQIIGHVSSQAQNLYRVLTENGETYAKVSGKFAYQVTQLSEYPAVGDFVVLDAMTDNTDQAVIHKVLPRKSRLARESAGDSSEEQLIATNIDKIFICMSLNEDYNLRRLERYLAIAWNSGSMPYIILTKTDLCADLDDKLAEIAEVAIGVSVICTTNAAENGYAEIEKHLESGKTSVFVGSSGVGKSTLINHFKTGGEITTDRLRNDDKGRHTTTQRDLYVLPHYRGMVIDTPGMRELGIGTADISQVFEDIDDLANICKFNDCTHTSEPKCAVKKAIKNGTLSEERLDSYQKLQLESEYDGMNAKMIEQTKLNRMLGGKKSVQKMLKEHKY